MKKHVQINSMWDKDAISIKKSIFNIKNTQNQIERPSLFGITAHEAKNQASGRPVLLQKLLVREKMNTKS